jgi:hypothetical protein
VQPNRVHLVGSIALDTADDVFRTCGKTLGRRLKRLPDGEPGGRRLWISWQIPVLRASPYLRPVSADPTHMVPLELAPDVAPNEIHFGELGYCREARVSYQDFCAARDRGEVAEDVRFQVSLPTPFAVITPFVRGDGMLPVLAAYEAAMIREVQAICGAIPHDDLSIQWDVCLEMLAWDGQPSLVPPIENREQVLLPPLGRLCDAIPSDVEVGIHLCYGDFDAKHFVDPIDAEKMVELANAIANAAKHPLAWVHLPVPIDRDDDEFFVPLKNLKLDAGTEVYLGLVHEDGAEATKRRIAVASKYLSDFGIATECGIARQRTNEQVEKLIRIHAETSVEPSS